MDLRTLRLAIAQRRSQCQRAAALANRRQGTIHPLWKDETSELGRIILIGPSNMRHAMRPQHQGHAPSQVACGDPLSHEDRISSPLEIYQPRPKTERASLGGASEASPSHAATSAMGRCGIASLEHE